MPSKLTDVDEPSCGGGARASNDQRQLVISLR